MEKVFESVEEGGTVDVPLKRKCKLMVMYCRSIIWMFSVKTHTCPKQAVDIYVHRFKMEIKQVQYSGLIYVFEIHYTYELCA